MIKNVVYESIESQTVLILKTVFFFFLFCLPQTQSKSQIKLLVRLGKLCFMENVWLSVNFKNNFKINEKYLWNLEIMKTVDGWEFYEKLLLMEHNPDPFYKNHYMTI